MKKTALALIISTIALSGCDNKQVKELTSQLQQKEQTITQLNNDSTKLNSEITALKSEVEKLQSELKAEQLKNAAFRPAISTQEEVLFKKETKVKLTDKEALAEIEKEYKDSDYLEDMKTTPISYYINTLKINLPWLNNLLQEKLYTYFYNSAEKVSTREELINNLTKGYEETVEEAKKIRYIGIDYSTSMNFIGQKENFATFTISNQQYTGGAHGLYSTEYVVVDLDKQSIITLKDLFTDKNKAKVRELLWERYKAESVDDSGNPVDPFTDKKEFSVSDNFFLTQDGIHFVYGIYEIGPFVEGEKELFLSWEELNPILNKPFQREIKKSEYY